MSIGNQLPLQANSNGMVYLLPEGKETSLTHVKDTASHQGIALCCLPASESGHQLWSALPLVDTKLYWLILSFPESGRHWEEIPPFCGLNSTPWSKWLQWQGLGCELHLSFPGGGRYLSTWAIIFYCFLRCTSGELDWKQNSPNSNQILFQMPASWVMV